MTDHQWIPDEDGPICALCDVRQFSRAPRPGCKAQPGMSLGDTIRDVCYGTSDGWLSWDTIADRFLASDWLKQHDAAIAAEARSRALEEGAGELWRVFVRMPGPSPLGDWIQRRVALLKADEHLAARRVA